jgi:hypothetical protein
MKGSWVRCDGEWISKYVTSPARMSAYLPLFAYNLFSPACRPGLETTCMYHSSPLTPNSWFGHLPTDAAMGGGVPCSTENGATASRSCNISPCKGHPQSSTFEKKRAKQERQIDWGEGNAV